MNTSEQNNPEMEETLDSKENAASLKEKTADSNENTAGSKEEAEYLAEVSKHPLLRVAAWLGLLIIVALIVLTFITGITGSRYFMPCLILCIIVPVLLYVFLWIGKVLRMAGKK